MSVSLTASRRRLTSSIAAFQPAERVDVTASLRRKTSTVAFFVPPIVGVTGSLRRKTSALGVQSMQTVVPTASLQRKTSDFLLAPGREVAIEGTLTRRTSDMAVLIEPGYLRRKSVHGHVLVQRGAWVETLVDLKPITYVPFDEPQPEVGSTYFHDYYGTKSDQFDNDEAEGRGPRGPSLVPGDPDGQSVGFSYADWWPYVEPTRHDGFNQTQLITVRLNNFSEPDAYLELFDDYVIDLTFYWQGYDYPSEVGIYNGAGGNRTWVPIPMFLDDLVDGQPHFIGVTVDLTNVQVWVDGMKILDAPHFGSPGQYSDTAQLYPFNSGDSGGVVTVDEVVIFDRALEMPEMAALVSAWQGETVTGPMWQLGFAAERQRRTAFIEVRPGENYRTVRWRLTDTATGEEWTMPINPDQMSSPLMPARQFAHGNGWRKDGRIRAMQRPSPAMEWEWSGVIRTKAHYDQLVRWAEKHVAVEVTDHLGRSFRVFITDFVPTDRTPTPRTSWRMRYSMKARILERAL